MDAFISPNDTGGVMKLVDSSAVVDNIFVFTDGTDKFQWTNNRKGVYPLSQAKVLADDSTDKTSILQAVFNHADIKVVELDAQQVITISGTLDAKGKVIRFTNGARFTGTAKINDAVILGEDDDQLFDTTITLTNSKSGKSYFSAKWYGAKGDNINNDAPALQTVLNTCITNKTKKIFFPAGLYKINIGIYLRGEQAVSGNTGFVENIVIEGPDIPYGGSAMEATIVCNNPESFALGLQKVKGCKVKNIAFIGPNTAPGLLNLYNVVQNPTASFVAGGVRDTNLSPNAGIVIDPFSDINCPAKYPDLESLYTEIGGGGSTDVLIESCVVRKFAVNYLISPTAFLQNAEKIAIKDCWGDFCKVAIAVGQSQTRNVYVENFACWGGTETVLDSARYGQGTGCPPDVNGLNIAGGVRHLCRLNTWFSNGMHIVNMHAELLGSLGGNFSGVSGKLTIKDSFIDLIGPMMLDSHPTIGTSIQPVVTLFQGDYLMLENCTLHHYGADTAMPVNLSVNNAVITNSNLAYIPLTNVVGPGASQLTFNSCSLLSNASPFGDGQIIYGLAPANFSNIAIPFITKMEWLTAIQEASLKRVKREKMYISNWRQYKGINVIPYSGLIKLSSVNLSSLEATFNLSVSSEFYKLLKLDDILLTYTTDEYNNNPVGTPLGKVQDKDDLTGNITIKYIIKGANITDDYYLAIYRQEALIPQLIIGDLSSGSNTITNVLLDNYSNNVPIGVTVFHKLLPDGTYIVSYDHTTGIIVLSNNATGTAERQTFVSSDWEGVQIGVLNVNHTARIGYKIGDKIINNDFITYPDVLHWTCVAPGVTATSLLPEFVATNI